MNDKGILLGMFLAIIAIAGIFWLVEIQPWLSPEEKHQIKMNELAERQAYFDSLPTEEQLFELYKKCADAGLSVEEKTTYKYNERRVSYAACGVPLAQKQAEEARKQAENDATEAAIVGAVGGFVVGQIFK